jgi:pimeloyl-ACP methyl ester carboxylesterase
VATLRDGRRLAYAEYGDPAGAPVFYFHGTPGSRYEACFVADAATRRGARIIAVDRPGFGRSDPKRGRTLLDFADDVGEFADILGIDRFAVAGLSGGGPYVEACAIRMPDRVTSGAIASGAGPPESQIGSGSWLRRARVRIELAIAPLMTWLLAWYMALTIRLMPVSWIPRFIDPNVLRRREVRAPFKREALEGMRHGGQELAHELLLLTRPFGFALRDIAVPISLWHGDADRVVKIEIGRWVAAEIPGCRATWVPGGAHLLIVDYADEIVAALV